tara:strand:+ start:2431 stop:2784 length:354 start_codon:yes stop_codon:yes gene_type:complete
MLYKGEPTEMPLMEAMHLIGSAVCEIEWTAQDMSDFKELPEQWQNRLKEILNLQPSATMKQVETVLNPTKPKGGRRASTKAKPVATPTPEPTPEPEVVEETTESESGGDNGEEESNE